MQTVIQPITTYILMAAGFAGLLFLHFSLMRQLERLRKQMTDDGGARRLEMTRLRAELLESPPAWETPPATPRGLGGATWQGTNPRLNVSRRSQVLRMSRSGDAPERIASALGVAKAEVDLLLKVHRTASA
jgi:hypothetical protein